MNDKEFKSQLLSQFKQTGIDTELRAKMAERLLRDAKDSGLSSRARDHLKQSSEL